MLKEWMARNSCELRGSVQFPAVARIFIFFDLFVSLRTPVYCWEIMPCGKAQCIWILWEISGSKSLSKDCSLMVSLVMCSSFLSLTLHIQEVRHKVCHNSGCCYTCHFEQTLLYQHVPYYPQVHRYLHFSVLRCCTVSLIMKHLYSDWHF